MTITFPCPACGKQYKTKPELAGKKIKCKDCGTVVPIPVPRNLADSSRITPDQPSKRAGVGTSAEVSFTGSTRGVGKPTSDGPETEETSCPHCRAVARILPDWRGKTLECPACRKRFVVPEPARHDREPVVEPDSAPSFCSEDDSGPGLADVLSEHESSSQVSNEPSDWLDRTMQKKPKHKRKHYEVHQTDCPFGVLLMGFLLVGVQFVTALLAVISMVRGIPTPELWGRLTGSLIGLAIGWGYLNGLKAALRLYQFLAGIQIVGLVAAAIATREVDPIISVFAGLAAVIGIVIYFYNFSPIVESYFRGEPVRYPLYLMSWHFYVPLSVCVVGVMAGYGASIAVQEELERERWALNADPSQVALLTITNVADQNTMQQVESRVKLLLGNGAQVKSEWNKSREKIKMAVAPVADVAAFSRRVDFGNVKQMKGRILEIEADAAALEGIAKAEESRRQEEQRKAAELAAVRKVEIEKRVEENKQRVEESQKKFAETSAARDKEWKDREKKIWEKASGPGWVLETKPGAGVLFTQRQLGYRVMLPTFWELNPAVNSVPTANPTKERESVFGFAHLHSRSSELRAIFRIETYAAEGDEMPIDVVKKWDKNKRSAAGYKRSGSIQEQKLGDLPCAGLAYSWKERNTDAEFEVWVVRRNQTIYAITIGANRRELNWSFSVDELRKSLQSFALIEPDLSEAEKKATDQERP